MTVKTRSLRNQLLIGASIGSMLLAGVAQAQDTRGRGGAVNPADAAVRAAQQQAARAAQTNSASQRAVAAFRRAAEGRNAMQAAQTAARAAAHAAQSNVPNGLGQGGLQVAEGVVFGPDGKPIEGSLWIGANGPTQSQGANGRTNVAIDQTQQKAILTWDSFNVGRETDLSFNQSGADAVVLNRVTDASADPSRILGSIKAPGTVLVLNRNGVIFGGASQVNVRNLIASSAALSDDQFLSRGIYSQVSQGDFLASFTDAAGAVTVEAGAQITTTAPKTVLEGGGYVMLLGTSVENAGSITTDRGQTLLAAGDDFLVRKGVGSEAGGGFTRGNEVRGLIDEDSESGSVINSGMITAARGDITLTGRNVTQDGVLVATTSVNGVGTVHLSTSASDAQGHVTLTGRSLTTILPELESDETALNSQRDGLDKAGLSAGTPSAQFDNIGPYGVGSKSQVDIVSGGDILFASGSTTMAQGGNVYANAGRRIQVENDATIDVSGTMGVALDMASNSIMVNVQGNELRDSPANRDVAGLKNQNVWVDVRDLILLPAGTGGYTTDRYYTPGGLLEVGGYLANTAHGIGEWTSVGGTISLTANEIVVREGAMFDISGGSLDYAAGYVRSTMLLGDDGRLYDARNAPSHVQFLGVGNAFARKHDRWGSQYTEVFNNRLFARGTTQRWEEGYTVGRDAGQLVLSSPTTLFQGKILAGVVTGSRQTMARPGAVADGYSLPQDVAALAGTLVLADFGGNTLLGTGSATDVRFENVPDTTVPRIGDEIDEQRIGTSWLESEMLNGFGLGGLRVATDLGVTVSSDLKLANGGQVSLSGSAIEVNADIVARGGDIRIDNMLDGDGPIVIGSGAMLDVRGVWTNATLDPLSLEGLAFRDGGSVSLRSMVGLTLEKGSVIDASSGAALLADGTVLGGRGGDVTLISDDQFTGNGAGLTLDGDVRAFGVAGGGNLTIRTARPIFIGDAPLLADGVLAAGEAAPTNLVLTSSATLPVGTAVPYAFSYRIDRAEGVVSAPVTPVASDAAPIQVTADWTIPADFAGAVYDDVGGQFFGGNVVPAGTKITFWSGQLEAGFNIPAEVFPAGLPISPLIFNVPAGPTIEPIVLPQGATLPQGIILDAAVGIERPVNLAPERFRSGFSNYDVRGRTGVLVQENTDLAVQMPVYRLSANSFDVATGADPARALELWMPPVVLENPVTGVMTQRAGASLTLAASLPGSTPSAPSTGGPLTVGKGATITVDPGQAVTLEARGQITVNGAIIAPGGDVRILDTQFGPEAINNSYDTGNRSIWLGETSRIDVAGRAFRAIDRDGDAYGLLFDGGSVLIGSAGGVRNDTANLTPSTEAFIVQRAGSVIDASGASLSIDVPNAGLDTSSTPLLLASDGGSIAFRTSAGLYLDGSVKAAAGGVGASGGTLSITLDTPLYQNITRPFQPFVLPEVFDALRVLTVRQERGEPALGADLTPRGSDPALAVGATIGADQIEAGGFGSLVLASRDLIRFDGDVSLALGRSLELRGVIAAGSSTDPATVALSAPYLLIGSDGPFGSVTGFDDYFAGLLWGSVAGGSVSGGYRGSESTADGSRISLSGAHVDVRDAFFGVAGRQGYSSRTSGQGNVVVDAPGFADVDIVSTGDIRFLGSLRTGDNVTLTAAQLYPATNTAATIAAGYASGFESGAYVPDRSLTIRRSGASDPAMPYSLFGTLTLLADRIDQGGVVRAPFGFIEVGKGGTDNVQVVASSTVFAPGSITSISGAGLVMPFGGTADGQTYTYGGDQYSLTRGSLNTEDNSRRRPDLRTILIGGDNILIDAGAVVDLSGGGELLGAAFVPGRGGSIDVLQAPLAAAGPGNALSSLGNQVYAVLPGYSSAATPEVLGANGGTPALGQQITLTEGLPGLPPGVYTLLPATFATLPGAYRVELGATNTQVRGVTATAGGSFVTGARLGLANTAIIDAAPTLAILTPSKTVRTLSGYNETSFAAFTSATATTFGTPRGALPADAGFLNIDLSPKAADRPLIVLGDVRQGAAEGGRGGITSVIAGSNRETPIEIRDAATEATDGRISLLDDDLNALKADTLILNGRLVNSDSDGTYLGSQVESVVVRSGSVLSAAQVFITADYSPFSPPTSITIESGATIDTTGYGAPGYSAENGTFLSRVGTTLGVSNGSIEILGGMSPGTGAGASLVLEDGAIIRSKGTVLMSATNELRIGDIDLSARDLNLALSAINIGDADALATAEAAGVLPAGWTLTQAQVDSLLRPAPGRTSVERLTLTVGQSLNLIGSVNFSTRGSNGDDDVELRLVAPAIYGLGDADDTATISTGRLVWSGVMNRVTSQDGTPVQFVSGTPGSVLAGGPGTGSGRLALVADEIVFGFLDGAQAQNAPDLQRLALGFSAVDVTGTERITANNSGTLAVYQSGTDPASYAGGNLTLSTPLLTGLQGSRMTYRAGGAIAVTAPAGSAVVDTAAIKTLGGEIRFDAGSALALGTSIALPSGRLVLAAGGDITLGDRAVIDLSGRTISFFDVDKHSWGGDLLIASESGSVNQSAGSVIDVSASDNDAGSIKVAALGTGGTLALGGTIRGTGGDGFDAGGFDARLHGLADFAGLNAQLNAAGFTQSRGILLKTGDIVIGDEVRANHVAIVADGGNLTVNGTINASGMRMGSISLVARDNLTLAPSAVLDAHGTVLQTDAYGAPIEASNRGRVDLTAATGTVTLASGATIDLHSADNVARSKVEINAPRAGDDDIAIAAGGTVNIRGASSVAVNAFRGYAPADGVINQALLDGIHGDSSAFIDAAGGNATLQGRLAGLSSYGGAFHLRPGVEIRSATPDGNLTVEGDLDLSGYRYGPDADPSLIGSGEAGVLRILAGGDLTINGSISDGFAPPPATPDDNRWGTVFDGYLDTDLVVANPLTLGSGTIFTFYDPEQTLNFSFEADRGSVNRGYAIPFDFRSAGTLTVPSYAAAQGGWVATAEIRDAAGNLLFSPGERVNRSLPAGTLFGAGIVLPSSSESSTSGTFRYAAGTVIPAGTSLAEILLNGEISALEGQVLTAGAVIPAFTYLNASSLTRPVGPDGTQGKIYAVAEMLVPGSESWSMRFASGADLASAHSRSLRSRAALGDAGRLTLDDKHFTGPTSAAEALSVIRTGTGDLELLAGGDYRQSSLFGVYTAGTQAEGVTDQYQVGLSRQADGTVLGGAYADYEAALAGYRAWYPEHGGDLSVTVQGDLRAYTVANSGTVAQSNTANWLWRQGGEEIDQAAAWWINFGTYVSRAPNGFSEPSPMLVGFSGFGALGGGNLTVTVAGDAGLPRLLSSRVVQTSGVDAAVGSTGRVLADGSLLQTGGGDVTIDVGGAFNRGGSFVPASFGQGGSAFLDGVLTAIRGNITLEAGAVGLVSMAYGLANPADPRAPATGPTGSTGYGGPAIALGDGAVSLRARGDVVLGTVLDPGRLRGNVTLAGVDGDPSAPANGESWFTLWTERSAVDLFSLGGSLTPNTRFFADGQTDGRNFFYPGTLRAVAAGGSIYGRQDERMVPLVLAPFANAELELLAADSFYGNGQETRSPPLVFAVSGSDPAFVATPFRPAYQLYQQGTQGTYDFERLGGNDWNNMGQIGELFRYGADTATGGLHRNTSPTRIYAVSGDIVEFRYGFSQLLMNDRFQPIGTDFVSGKPIHARAGRDIVAFGSPVLFAGSRDIPSYQSSFIIHADPTDLSVISAGRDIFYANADIAGPGDLVVSAGRNIYQGGRGVFHSTGPIGINAASAERGGGAGITLLAGVGAGGPAYADFASLYLDPANLADAERPLADQTGKVVKTYDAELAAWLTDRYGWSAADGPALDTFLALSPDEQGLFARSVYFEELRQAGREYNEPDGRRFGSYLRGRQAIATLFPGTAYDGDITMFGERVTYSNGGVPQAPNPDISPFNLDSAVLTDFGGDVQLLAPGGAVTLGADGVQPSATSGLLTQGSGDIQVFAKQSILLGLSRTFTTFGGDITMWSAEGDINAGRGAKTTIVFAPVRRIYDQIGNVALSPAAPTSGAGIGTLNPIPEVPAGDIDLIAPLGTIDAGEAGIRVSGNVNLAALQVLNAANIQVQGEASGIPLPPVVNTGALTAASAATTAVVNEAAQLAERARPAIRTEVPIILNVRFLGFGPAE